MPNNSVTTKVPYSLWSDKKEILRRATLGVREVVRDHALAGRSVAAYRNGEVVLVSPEEILKPRRRAKTLPQTPG